MTSSPFVPLTGSDVRSLRGSSASIIELTRCDRRDPLVFRCVRRMIVILPLVLRPACASAEENSIPTYFCRNGDSAPSVFPICSWEASWGYFGAVARWGAAASGSHSSPPPAASAPPVGVVQGSGAEETH